MPLFVFASAKGAPGATTTLVGVAARWPASGQVSVIEADPRGGDLAARFALMPAPGLASAATDPTLAADPSQLARHAQPLPPAAVPALLGPAQGTSAAAAVRAVTATGILGAAGRTQPLLIDVGAIEAASAALPLCAGADLVLLTVRDRLEDLVHAAAVVDLLHSHQITGIGLLVRQAGGLSATAVGREFDLPVLADIPTDPHGAAVLCGHAMALPGWTRLRLPRTCAGLAKALAQHRPSAPAPALNERVAAA